MIVYTGLKQEWNVPKEEVNQARIIDFEMTGDTLKLELFVDVKNVDKKSPHKK